MCAIYQTCLIFKIMEIATISIYDAQTGATFVWSGYVINK